MRPILIFTSFVVALLSRSFAEGISDGGFAGSTSLPGFDLKDENAAPISGSDLSPAVTFSVAMKGAFMTPDGIKLTTATHGTVVTPWGGSKNGARRMRSMIGTSTSGGANNADSGITGTTVALGGLQATAVPEPGTFLTGLLLFGVCSTSRNRGSRRD